MAKQKVKAIHLIRQCGSVCKATCDAYYGVKPIEATIIKSDYYCSSKGTFNPKKVTCKRCLKHPDYKIALDKVNNPLFYWQERT